jgi:predicted KAP-like P-loop ATPase
MNEERLNRKISKLLKKVGANQTLYQTTVYRFLSALRNGRNGDIAIQQLKELLKERN